MSHTPKPDTTAPRRPIHGGLDGAEEMKMKPKPEPKPEPKKEDK